MHKDYKNVTKFCVYRFLLLKNVCSPRQCGTCMPIIVVGILGLGVYYLFVYWACDPIRGREVVRGRDIFARRDYVNE